MQALPNIVPNLFPKQTETFEEKAKREIKFIGETLSDEELLRVAYVPFVVCRLVWDYVDTILDLCVILKRSETKKLCRAVRELRQQYQRQRYPIIDKEHDDGEERNMYIFENFINVKLNVLAVNIAGAISMEHPDLSQEYSDLLKAVYMAHALLKAVKQFSNKMTSKAAKRLKMSLGSMLPKSVHALDSIILDFAGDKRLSDEFMKREQSFIDVLATQMELIEFTNKL